VPAMRGQFDGVHLDVWTEAMRDLRRRNLVKASLSQHYVDDAVRAISAMGNLAMARANIASPTITAEDLARHEAELLYGFDIVGDDNVEGSVTANRDKNGTRDRFANATPIADVPTGAPPPAPANQDSTTTTEPAGRQPTIRTRKSNTKLEK
jgi:putative transposase